MKSVFISAMVDLKCFRIKAKQQKIPDKGRQGSLHSLIYPRSNKEQERANKISQKHTHGIT